MADGVKTTTAGLSSVVDEVLAHNDGSLVRIGYDKLAAQLAATGAVADKVTAAASGLVRASTVAGLTPGTRVGQPGQVTTGAGKGEYSWNGSAWVKVGELIDPVLIQGNIDAVYASLDASKQAASSRLDSLALIPASSLPILQATNTADRRSAIGAAADTTLQDDAGIVVYSNTLLLAEGTLYLDNQGRKRTEAPGVPRLDAQPYAFSQGTNYDVNQSLILPPANIDNGITVTGQSWGQAAAAGDPGGPYSTVARDPKFALMPIGNVRPSSNAIAGYEDLRSIQINDPDTGAPEIKESILPEAVHTMLLGFNARFGTKPRFIGDVVARGGQPYSALKRGSAGHARIIALTRQKVAISLATQGRRYVQRAIYLCHGEDDYALPAWLYYRLVRQWLRDLDADIRAITGQTEPVLMLFYAPCRGRYNGDILPSGSTQALRDLALNEPELACMVGAGYGVQLANDAHPTVLGYRQLGYYFGRADLRHSYGTGFRPTDVLASYRTGNNTARLEIFVPDGGALVRDESSLIVGYPSDPSSAFYIGPPSAGNEPTARDGGFYATDRLGQLGVVSATVASGNKIDIGFHRTPEWGSVSLQYAMRSQSGGSGGTNATGPRGIFRGSIAGSIPDSSIPLHDWLIPQEVRL